MLHLYHNVKGLECQLKIYVQRFGTAQEPSSKENYNAFQDEITMTAKLYETPLNDSFLQNT